MSIDPDKFKNELAKEFTKLLNSKRGIASELANAICKDPSFINGIKRNKPVNALHLKAVELILGPEIAIKLLAPYSSIEPFSKTKEINNNNFKATNEGEDAIKALLEIENMNEQTFRRTVADLKFIADKLKEGAIPGPLITVPENKPLGEFKTQEKNTI